MLIAQLLCHSPVIPSQTMALRVCGQAAFFMTQSSSTRGETFGLINKGWYYDGRQKIMFFPQWFICPWPRKIILLIVSLQYIQYNRLPRRQRPARRFAARTRSRRHWTASTSGPGPAIRPNLSSFALPRARKISTCWRSFFISRIILQKQLKFKLKNANSPHSSFINIWCSSQPQLLKSYSERCDAGKNRFHGCHLI